MVAKAIVLPHLILMDGKVSGDMFYPTSFQDVITIDMTRLNLRCFR